MKTNPNGDYSIDLHEVKKTYRGNVHALQGIEMQVHRGQIFGLLGPNGAGKSTLVKIMMTVVRPTSALGTILGKPVGHQPTLERVGYLPENHRLPNYLTGRQVLDFYAALAKVPGTVRRQRAEQLLEMVGMTRWADQRINKYSKGMLQRTGLAQALMNDPDLLVLDEPTDGVDPVGRREIRDVLLQLKQKGKTIFLNSHLLSELEAVCDRVAILVQGRVAMQGTIDDLTAASRRYEIIIEGSAPEWVASEKSLNVQALSGGQSKITLAGAEPSGAQPILDRLRQSNCMIVAMQPVRESLEDLFMRAVQDPATGKSLQVGAAR
jgi:ABC-2 type transport system ATP-binding protein